MKGHKPHKETPISGMSFAENSARGEEVSTPVLVVQGLLRLELISTNINRGGAVWRVVTIDYPWIAVRKSRHTVP